ncbi:Pachytene checkpoint protein 2 [Actinomortierella ambigua]|nr:Pachytene checkpoint protein 2 [Actinomortierella ambigua]
MSTICFLSSALVDSRGKTFLQSLGSVSDKSHLGRPSLDGAGCALENLTRHLEHLWVAECSGDGRRVDNTTATTTNSNQPYTAQEVDLSIHIYQLQSESPIEEYDRVDNGYSDESILMAHHWTLPSQDLEGVWDTLVFDDQVDLRLLEYVYTAMLFSDRMVNPNLITWNRVLLLYGPPGTGKTTLCRALAHKLSIRMAGKYRYTKMLEINSHSLFSKWFSESGKMVQKMFDNIWELVNDPYTFVIVLIDEVESLASARTAALSGNEPTDSIRVVNALLTQIDKLKKQRNVLIMTTSNMKQAIDTAFLDRADMRVFIGPPSQRAIYSMLRSSLHELVRAGIVYPPIELPEVEEVLEAILNRHSPSSFVLSSNQITAQSNNHAAAADGNSKALSILLYETAGACRAGHLSGRAVRRLPFVAHASYVQISYTNKYFR